MTAIGVDAARRALLGAGAGAALAAVPSGLMAQPAARSGADLRPMMSAASCGVPGDGVADDSRGLQAALDAAFRPDGPGFLVIPPGTYRVTRTLRVATGGGARGNITRHCGILAHGARLKSDIG